MNQFMVNSCDQSIVISVVSHGHAKFVNEFLNSLLKCNLSAVKRVVLTINKPESISYLNNKKFPFILDVRENKISLGFSENHNRALNGAGEDIYCIINPDVEMIEENSFIILAKEMSSTNVGLLYPIQISEEGVIQDSERSVPSPWNLFLRYLTKTKEKRIDWVNAAFWMIPQSVWLKLNGLNEKYFMYCEDVDFCLRLHLKKIPIIKSSVCIRHVGQRDSHRRVKNYFFHVHSLIRLWCSSTYWRFLKSIKNA